MTEPSERIGTEHRLRSTLDSAAVKRSGRALRARHCLVVSLERPGEPTRVGFVASKRGVGNAVHRNRARRRLREIVRRLWPGVKAGGVWMMFVAFRTCVSAPHSELVDDVRQLLVGSGAISEEPSS
jgi:ribonuclease P protein component